MVSLFDTPGWKKHRRRWEKRKAEGFKLFEKIKDDNVRWEVVSRFLKQEGNLQLFNPEYHVLSPRPPKPRPDEERMKQYRTIRGFLVEAGEYEMSLYGNKSKGDWLNQTPKELAADLMYHQGKLTRAVYERDATRIVEHAADVLNLLIMLGEKSGVFQNVDFLRARAAEPEYAEKPTPLVSTSPKHDPFALTGRAEDGRLVAPIQGATGGDLY